ncbi:transposase [Ruminococcus sp. CLA-AA-H200]|uniref:Transposase n=1 Tax=Ruminococcus turbiniformis TaxID=2881258 RepID=A0ABS8G170_9FIRM|nr:transposase [Ruminococcus turbiniformis]MCC2255962.1 transposase [Ruminococcus turbiniformis]
MPKRFPGQRGKEKADAVEQVAYRFEGFPDTEQECLLRQYIGAARFLWNRMLDDWKSSYEEKGQSDPIKTPAEYKKEPGLKWLRDMDSLCLCNVQMRFISAVNDFLSGKKGYPQFKKKHVCRDSYTTNLSNAKKENLYLEGCMLKLPKVKEPVKLRVHRKIRAGGLLKSCTVTHEPNGKWYFSLVFEYPKKSVGKKAAHKTEVQLQAIGLDMSLPELYADSNGDIPSYPKPYRNIEKRIAREQRRLSRMKKDSNNSQKRLVKIAKLHAKAKHQRADFLHKLSYRLVTDYDLVCIEDLDLSAIKKALSFGKSVSDNGWGMFTDMLDYKAGWYGCVIIRIDKWFPSSKKCSVCGHVYKELKLSDRQYICPECGNVMGRDHQAAINIRNEGMRVYLDSLSA